ncbi:hypothetical protein BGZ65_003997 [Modicella reniformis]|uniref:Uncharacterized protein n=1 Tax=Modicella reniformis TaxID=1440133 RepID=A0A9P6MHT4_9FUNG|nr:hypothetical protein BGZ65_003997 [Modicella reniformis]
MEPEENIKASEAALLSEQDPNMSMASIVSENDIKKESDLAFDSQNILAPLNGSKLDQNERQIQDDGDDQEAQAMSQKSKKQRLEEPRTDTQEENAESTTSQIHHEATILHVQTSTAEDSVKQAHKETSVDTADPDMSMASILSEDNLEETDLDLDTRNLLAPMNRSKLNADQNEHQIQDDGDNQETQEVLPEPRKQRLEGSCVDKLYQLTLENQEKNTDFITSSIHSETEASTTLHIQTSTAKDLIGEVCRETYMDPEMKTESNTGQPQKVKDQTSKTVQSASLGTEPTVKVETLEVELLCGQDPDMSMASIVSEDGVGAADLAWDTQNISPLVNGLKPDEFQSECQLQDDDDGQDDRELPQKPKRQRLKGAYVKGENTDHVGSPLHSESESSATSHVRTPTVEDLARKSGKVTGLDSKVKSESSTNQIQEKQEQEQEIREFNRNTEQMIEVYFKEGLDEAGIEMFDTLLGPFRRPTKEFVAAFFYSIILSPYTDQANIEAAIHVLDRTLTIHGPELFQDIWDVQKRRREVADGCSAFSRNISSSDIPELNRLGSSLGSSTRASAKEEDPFVNMPGFPPAPIPTGRLPSWTNTWDLIKTEFGLDAKSESQHHIALQEYNIRMRPHGMDVAQDPSSTWKGAEEGMDVVIKEEREIRDEVGRAIVGLLIRILEQDAVLRNDVLMINSYSPNQTVRQALDVIFSITALAMSSRYLEAPRHAISSSIANAKPNSTAATSNRPIVPWPLNERCKLNAAGMEILQLGQQLLLLLIRFLEAGEILSGNGMEELAIELQSRLNKVNKDRKIPGSSSSSRSGASAKTPSATPYFPERCNLDQTEIFLKSLIQGPCLLDSGTGSGAGVKLRKEKASRQRQQSEGADINDCFVGADDYDSIFKSQTGICMGSSAFVMIFADYWFRSKTTAAGRGPQLSFRRVVEDYAMPNVVRTSAPVGTSTCTKKEKTKPTTIRKSARNRKNSLSSEDDNLELESISVSPVADQQGLEQWNAKDLEQVEWTVMMIEVLVWSWIEARGIRREEIERTGLEKVLFPDADKSNQQSIDENTSGWLVMSKFLHKIGGTLQSRWEQLESVIEAAIMVEDLCLR